MLPVFILNDSDRSIMKSILAVAALALVAAASTPAQPAPFAEAIISRGLTQRMQDESRWEATWIDEVVLHQFSAAERQELMQRYKGHVPQPKLETTRMVPPMYPLAMQKKGVSGQVNVYVAIARNGTVSDVYVTDYTDEAFAKAAALSLKFWTFKPLKQECLVEIPVPFNAPPKPAEKHPDGAAP